MCFGYCLLYGYFSLSSLKSIGKERWGAERYGKCGLVIYLRRFKLLDKENMDVNVSVIFKEVNTTKGKSHGFHWNNRKDTLGARPHLWVVSSCGNPNLKRESKLKMLWSISLSKQLYRELFPQSQHAKASGTVAQGGQAPPLAGAECGSIEH